LWLQNRIATQTTFPCDLLPRFKAKYHEKAFQFRSKSGIETVFWASVKCQDGEVVVELTVSDSEKWILKVAIFEAFLKNSQPEGTWTPFNPKE
jgi:hypothetical protein